MLITDIAQSVKNGDSESTLNEIIQAYIDLYETESTVKQWRIDNYIQLRRWAYPPIEDYVDAQVKIAQKGSLELEGKSQLNSYTGACYSVKLRFPRL